MPERKYQIGDHVYVIPPAYRGLKAIINSYKSSGQEHSPLYGVEFSKLPFRLATPLGGVGFAFYEFEIFVGVNHLCICHDTDKASPECLECVVLRFP